jgi:ascorbate-specific PTS system EIIC-type component UlaA
MRLTIVAGLIMGLSLAIQSMLGAQATAKVGDPASAARSHARAVAPWYVAMKDVRRENPSADTGTDCAANLIRSHPRDRPVPVPTTGRS